MRAGRAKLGWAMVLLDPATLERAKTALGAAGTSEAIHHALTLAADRPHASRTLHSPALPIPCQSRRTAALTRPPAGARAPASASRASAGA